MSHLRLVHTNGVSMVSKRTQREIISKKSLKERNIQNYINETEAQISGSDVTKSTSWKADFQLESTNGNPVNPIAKFAFLISFGCFVLGIILLLLMIFVLLYF